MSLAPSLTQASPVRHGRTGRIALWAVQIALAGMFLLAGSSKLLSAPAMVGLFDAIGIGQWFRYVTGSIEVVSAVALLVPAWAAFGALLLIPDDGRRRDHPSVHRRRVSGTRNRAAHRIPRGRVGTS